MGYKSYFFIMVSAVSIISPIFASDDISTESLDKEYSEFRKKYRIPSLKLRDEVVKNYIEHYIKDPKVKKNEELKSEAIKLLEAEKSLYASYEEFYKDKVKFKLEKALLKRAGIDMEREVKHKISDSMDAKVDLLGKKFSKIVKSSVEKLYDALPKPENKIEIFMASGGRYAPNVSQDDDYDQFLKSANANTIKQAERSIASEVKVTGIQKKDVSSALQLEAKLKGKLSEEEFKLVKEQLAIVNNKESSPEDISEAMEKLEDEDLITRGEMRD